MKVKIKGNFEFDMMEVPEKLAKEIEEKLTKLTTPCCNFDVKLSEDEKNGNIPKK